MKTKQATLTSWRNLTAPQHHSQQPNTIQQPTTNDESEIGLPILIQQSILPQESNNTNKEWGHKLQPKKKVIFE
jgi:hypothetical protein